MNDDVKDGLAGQYPSASLPLEHSVETRIVTLVDPLDTTKEHFAVVFGPPQAVPLVRIHSECVTGDVLGSLRCDCGPQLRESMNRLKTEGGILIYLRQEGRGIGLHKKIAAYRLQEAGADTYTANEMLGHGADERSFGVATEFLKANGIHSVRLISNNPRKRSALERNGIHVAEVLTTKTYQNPFNVDYLSAKLLRESHALSIEPEQP
jgi:GTP cyclohydrolase II